MKIEIVDKDKAKITPESDFEQHFWDTLQIRTRQDKATIESLTKNIHIIADDNSYLRLLLDNNNIEYNKEAE